MKLIDILCVADEYKTLKVIDNDSLKELDCYEGKNAIDEKWNDCEVILLSTDVLNGLPVMSVYIKKDK
jgi:hypothetical protein